MGFDGPVPLWLGPAHQLVPETLMAALLVIVSHVLGDRPLEGAVTH